VSIYGEYSGKIFDTDLSAVAATYIHWRLPGLGSRVAVTLLSIEKCDQAVMDFLAATDVAKFPPKMSRGARAGGQRPEE